MIAAFGNTCLMASLVLAGISSFLHLKERSGRLAAISTHAATVFVSMSGLLLVTLFITDSFEIKYVYEHSSKELPIIYKISAAWSGAEGSLLFFAIALVVWGDFILIRTRRELKTNGDNLSNAIHSIIVIFFLSVVAIGSNPFASASLTANDGLGLEDSLKTAYMLIHPPLVYIGFAGFTWPFADALSKLLRPKNIHQSLAQLKRFTLIAWTALSAGVLLGSVWASNTTGWGGFWSWDPVENAGLIPWLIAAAFLHSLAMERKTKLFRRTNIVIAIVLYLSTLSGIAIARTETLISLHTFSSSNVGVCFAIFSAVVLVFSALIVSIRISKIERGRTIRKIFSIEGAFLFNIVLLIGAGTAVLWGTIRPFFAGDNFSSGHTFFGRTMPPFGVGIFLLTIVCLAESVKNKRMGSTKNWIHAGVLCSLAGLVTVNWLFWIGAVLLVLASAVSLNKIGNH